MAVAIWLTPGAAALAQAPFVEPPSLSVNETADSYDFALTEQILLSDLADGRLDSFTLADAVLVASGVKDPAEMQRHRARLEQLVTQAARVVGSRGSAARRGRRLLAELHRTALGRYELSADRFSDLLDQGVYNCVSATLLYLIAAPAVGLDASAAETPLHVFVTVGGSTRRYDVEVTSPRGFDVRHDMVGFQSFVLANKYATPEEIARRGIESIFNEFHGLTRPVAPEQVLAFLYHNAGARALQAGDAPAAAASLMKAARIYPRLARRSDDLRTTLAVAVRELFDRGMFREALDLAGAALSLFPDRVSVRDRYVAVAARMVEQTAMQGDPTGAERIEAAALTRIEDEESRRKLESLCAPVLSRAAVVAGDWPVARRHAARYRASSSDPLEAERFARWVESRAAEVADGSDTGPAGNGELTTRMRAALAALAAEPEPARDGAAMIRAVGALASQGRFDEALAVGRMQRASLAEGVESTDRFDELLKAVVEAQINQLLDAGRWRDAGDAAARALARWPGDGDFIALQQRSHAVMSRDPYRLGAWPEPMTLRYHGRGSAGSPR